MKKYLLAASTIILLNACMAAAFAGERTGMHPLLSDRFVIGIGGMQADLDGSASLNSSSGGDGTDIDLEDDLGFNGDESIWAASFKWRITDKWNLSLAYLSINQDSKTIVTETINWGDLQFQPGSFVDAEFDLGVTRAFLGYSLIKTEQAELGIGAGIHFLDLDAKLGGQANVNGIQFPYASENADFLAPLPNLSIYGGYAFSPKWYIGAYADWLSFNIDDYSGDMTGFGANLQYQAFKHAGVGIGYQYFNIDVRADNSDWNGKVDYTYQGPSVFMTVNF